jgi:hypothetical protein
MWWTEMGWTMRWWWTRPTQLWDWILQKMGAKLIEIYNVNSTSCVLNTKMNAHKYSQTGSLPGTFFKISHSHSKRWEGKDLFIKQYLKGAGESLFSHT